MRTKTKPSDDDAFDRRLQEKEAQRDELFLAENRDSAVTKDYVHRQSVEKPKKVNVGKPAFAPKF